MEEWKLISANTNYEVSTFGRIRSVKSHRILKPFLCKNGYFMVSLSYNNAVTKYLVHRLVAEAFCDKIRSTDTVDHIDRNRQNNESNNLRWISHSKNCLNKVVIPTNTGERNIYKRKNRYKVHLTRNQIRFASYYGSLQEAIEARDVILASIVDEI